MATIISGNKVKLNDGSTVTAQQGGWYDGQQFWDNTLSDPGVINSNSNQIGAGKAVSKEVVAQTNPNNVSYLDSQIKASQLQSPISVPYTSNASSEYVSSISSAVEKARAALQSNIDTRQKKNDAEMAVVKQKEKETLDKIGELSTPFRENLENTERDRLSINKNFEENQKLVDELETLLNEGNALIKQQQSVTGIAAIRNPRIQQTMNDVAARAGVIQAVMAARNSQISVAENMIDRSITAIAQDKNDQLNYYKTILQLNNQDKMTLSEENRTLALQQVALLQGDLEQAQITANYVKQLMLDPATAQLVADSGVTLNDSVETINQKIAQGSYLQEVRELNNKYTSDGAKEITDPSGVPQSKLRSEVDSRGVVHYYRLPSDPVTTYTTDAPADSWLTNTTSASLFYPEDSASTPTTQVSPQTYSTLYSIGMDVLSSSPDANSSAQIAR